MPERVVLIGPPGSGKSTVGGLLARELAMNFTDTDRLVEEKAGKKIAEIFVEDGEETFRAMEEVIVEEVLKNQVGVISLGGGSILSSTVQETLLSLLKSSDLRTEVVFLDVSIAYAAPRVGFNRERPLLLVNPRSSWQELMNKRRPIYQSLASIVVDTNQRTPEEVVEEITKMCRR